ncbi:beta-1,4 N-acetylgalactosaminyltransferase 1-like isoform X2 [Branchiostoma floridae]|uniref:Beta-1,4 N-acetylgalactosaminyltransferase 1-like isoform X2 n=1 Tax=Branchiostoma floridae TaxID=7739 RepID=A0A9J7KQT7_BRAFL|nr:beta-1,4 N-acetylgalactosaminyltransferase 1-like isoform X2 [Branchiostoma floridae]
MKQTNHLLNQIPGTWECKQEHFQAISGYEIRTFLRPLERNQDHLVKFDQTVLSGLKDKSCSKCFSPPHDPATPEQKKASLTRYERRRIDLPDMKNQVDGLSPISYPAHGVYVRPMRSVWLKGIRVELFNSSDVHSNKQMEFQINATRGIFQLAGRVRWVSVNGIGANTLKISTRSPSLLNLQLKYIVYRNTEFDANIVDFAKIRFSETTVTMPIHIQHVQLPWLFIEGKGQIQDRVTVAVKTFLRYSRLRNAIKAVDQLYPGTRIVVADDTPDHLFTSFQSSNVDHFRMPAYTGYFAGRNLGLSQVSTEYFFYQDDDMMITEETKLDMLVSFLDNTNFHLVSVAVARNLFATTFDIFGNKSRTCIDQKTDPGYYMAIKNFPGFYANDVGLNAFLASTNEVKAVGFDPHPALARLGHGEFFLSALGRLRIAACEICSIRHMKGGFDAGNYTLYRRVSKKNTLERNIYNQYMHNVDCFRKQWTRSGETNRNIKKVNKNKKKIKIKNKE